MTHNRRGENWWRNGLRAGYTQYRYGSPEPVTLPRIFKEEKRKSLVDKVMDNLRDWRLSPFEYEGVTVSGLRSELCLKGHSWRRSNSEAVALVSEALNYLGAERPSYIEGQAEYAVSSDYCAWCFGPIEADSRFGARRFCSAEHARAAMLHRRLRQEAYDSALRRGAERLISNAKAEPKPCAHCGTPFRNALPKQLFCSPVCKQAASRVLPDVDCAWCGKTFRPVNVKRRWCSPACREYSRHAKMRESFAGQTRICACCGERFTPAMDKAIYCSRRCKGVVQSVAFRVRHGQVKTMTPVVFDYMVRMAA